MGRGFEVVVFLGALATGCGRSEIWLADDSGGAATGGHAGTGLVVAGRSAGGAGSAGFGGASFGGAGFGGGGAGGAGFGGGGFGGGGFGGAGAGGMGAVGPAPTIPAECGTFATGPGLAVPGPPLCASGRRTYSVLFYMAPGSVWRPADMESAVALSACGFAPSGVNVGALTPAILDAVDVLIVMPQRELMPPEEKEELREFVGSGRPALVLVDYASEATSPVEVYQESLDLVGAVFKGSPTGPGPTFPSLLPHPITQGIGTMAVYAWTAISGEGYVPLATLGCPIFIAKDTGSNRFVVSGDSTPFYGGHEFGAYDNERLFLQTMEWLVHER